MKARPAEPEEISTDRQSLSKHVLAATSVHATVQKLLESVFYAVHAKVIQGPAKRPPIFGEGAV
jgi:hypothetical protein